MAEQFLPKPSEDSFWCSLDKEYKMNAISLVFKRCPILSSSSFGFFLPAEQLLHPIYSVFFQVACHLDIWQSIHVYCFGFCFFVLGFGNIFVYQKVTKKDKNIVYVVLRIESRLCNMLGKHSITELFPYSKQFKNIWLSRMLLLIKFSYKKS